MLVMAVNCGSSSVKLRVIEIDREQVARGEAGAVLAKGSVSGIGGDAEGEVSADEGRQSTLDEPVGDQEGALRWLFDQLRGISGDGSDLLGQIDAIGHRVVHGGERFTEPVLITAELDREIDALSELAPLHNPASLAGVRAARAALGDAVPMVAVFDTAFHRTMPVEARTYALPHELAERHRILRYGFHGIAHASLAAGYARCSGRSVDRVRLITLQLGNGCSATAIDRGRSVETSMGFTPLEGLVMGTRSGDLDPSIVAFLAEREKVDPAEVERWLNQRSGLHGVSGGTSDMRALQKAASQGDERAKLAVDVFCHRARKYVGAYLATLGGADAIVFGGGIGENSPEIRARICAAMEWCGLRMDETVNEAAVGLSPGEGQRISAEGARLEAFVVATDEESWIARETVRCLQQNETKD